MPFIIAGNAWPMTEVTHKGTRDARRRDDDRTRKRRERARQKELGIPASALVNHALAEALSFSYAGADRREWRRDDVWEPVNISLIIAVAVDILAINHRCDREHSLSEVMKKIRPRREHFEPHLVPSLAPGRGNIRYKTRSPNFPDPSAATS